MSAATAEVIDLQAYRNARREADRPAMAMPALGGYMAMPMAWVPVWYVPVFMLPSSFESAS